MTLASALLSAYRWLISRRGVSTMTDEQLGEVMRVLKAIDGKLGAIVTYTQRRERDAANAERSAEVDRRLASKFAQIEHPGR
jgi:hypothetical protein